ncbi:unnamed protein product, partial [marine sediment metagenome]
ANVMIMGISPNPVEVRNFIVDKIGSKLRGFFVIPTTFIVCNETPYESYYISEDALSKFTIGSLPLFIRSWFPDFYRLGANANIIMQIQHKLVNHENEVTSLTSDFKREILKPLLQAVMTDNAGMAVRAVLPWFAEVEHYLAENFFPFLASISSLQGDDLANAEFDIRKSLGLLREITKEITLANRLKMYYLALRKYRNKNVLFSDNNKCDRLTEIR